MIACVIVLSLLTLLIATDPEPGETRPNHDIARRHGRASIAAVYPLSP
jgi:hypothetical protein